MSESMNYPIGIPSLKSCSTLQNWANLYTPTNLNFNS